MFFLLLLSFLYLCLLLFLDASPPGSVSEAVVPRGLPKPPAQPRGRACFWWHLVAESSPLLRLLPAHELDEKGSASGDKPACRFT